MATKREGQDHPDTQREKRTRTGSLAQQAREGPLAPTEALTSPRAQLFDRFSYSSPDTFLATESE